MGQPRHPQDDVAELEQLLQDLAREAGAYLASLGGRAVRAEGWEEAADSFRGRLPEEGSGAAATLERLLEVGLRAAVHSAGPRFFHFVIGGVTPAALGADWITSLIDQNAGAWVATPLGSQLEAVSLAWLRDLFELPEDWAGVLTTGATMANFTALAAARQWWGAQHGVDVAREGLAGLEAVPVLTSGYVHASTRKALAMLGLGQDRIRVFARDGVGRLDRDGLEAALRALDGAPAILIATAGEVDAGDFDPLEEMAQLAERYGAWLHVDGAFGLFARLSPRTAHLTRGLERAHSVIADGHKWLNVPYDTGFAFVHHGQWLAQTFGSTGSYLPDPHDPRPNFMYLGPEMSRRARGLTVWATLHAYGRAGYRAMIERHHELALHLARRVDEAPDLERLAEPRLNIVCFRLRPFGTREEALDDLNRRLGEAILADGRVYAGTTVYGGRVALRPAIANWRTTREDVDLLVDVIRELGARLVAEETVAAG